MTTPILPASGTPRLADTRKKCPDGRLRCLDCETPEGEWCHGHAFGCGSDDSYRIRIDDLERDLQAAQRELAEARRDAEDALIKLCEDAADHIHENATRLIRFGGDCEPEVRARELGAMYVRELASNILLDRRLAELEQIAKEPK